MNLGKGEPSILALLEISAAFDIDDHASFISRQQIWVFFIQILQNSLINACPHLHASYVDSPELNP